MSPPVKKKTKRTKADLWGPPGELMGMKVQRKALSSSPPKEKEDEKKKTSQEPKSLKKKKQKVMKKFKWISI
jgi:hypothetical protein